MSEEKVKVRVELPAKWIPEIATCQFRTCRHYVAILGKWSLGCLNFPSQKDFRVAVKKLAEKLEEKVRKKINELGIQGELEWGLPNCYCPYAEGECVQLFFVLEAESEREAWWRRWELQQLFFEK